MIRCEKPSLRHVHLCFLLEPRCSHVCLVPCRPWPADLTPQAWHRAFLMPAVIMRDDHWTANDLGYHQGTCSASLVRVLLVTVAGCLVSPWGPSSPALVADAALLLSLRQESRDSESRVWAGLQPLSKGSSKEAFHRSVSRLSLFLTPDPQLQLCHHRAPSP